MPPKQFNTATGDVKYLIQAPSGEWLPISPDIPDAQILTMQRAWPYVELVCINGSIESYVLVDRPTEGMILEQSL